MDLGGAEEAEGAVPCVVEDLVEDLCWDVEGAMEGAMGVGHGL